jgi:tripartite-type tricarboxylate transporter receptor subunit TctC
MFAFHTRTAAILAVAVAGALVAIPARADSVADFYKGKTITITVGTEAGNSYDVYTRTLARRLSRHVPGSPSFIVHTCWTIDDFYKDDTAGGCK